MKTFTKFATIFAFAMLVLALPAVASAQRDRDRDDDYYGRNRNDDDYYNRRNRNDDDYNRRNRNRDDDYYGNGRYNNNRNLRGVVERLRNRARNFEQRTDRYNGRNNDPWGNNRSSNLENLADRFARATDNLADAYGRGRNMDNSRDEARRVLDIGSQIENELYRSRYNRNGNGDWDQISYDLRTIADAYGLNYYRNNNRNRSGDWRNRVPFPLPF